MCTAANSTLLQPQWSQRTQMVSGVISWNRLNFRYAAATTNWRSHFLEWMFAEVGDAPQPSMRLAASLHDAAASANDLRQLGGLASAVRRSLFRYATCCIAVLQATATTQPPLIPPFGHYCTIPQVQRYVNGSTVGDETVEIFMLTMSELQKNHCNYCIF